LDDEEIAKYLEDVENVMSACADVMPSHARFIAENCAASKVS